ncbi:Spo0E family sporulation regulatory protein-aspartic acid phosphatase [Gorillibacterium sp. sgz500922]|uniref:Spo0E family sporulation regulatory protein-aspartic acid phosphatase n=1 Tax=Gorillibacterium sp. sgz500922 TaxID=3446694 RepID=UPI003F6655A7
MELSSLSERIELLRAQLNLLAGRRDTLVHPHVVSLSQELDQLIIHYQQKRRVSA